MQGIFAHAQDLAITASNQAAITVGSQAGKYMFLNLFRASVGTDSTAPVYSYGDFFGYGNYGICKIKTGSCWDTMGPRS
eukprot:8992590-Karenia_brevis.AAC.1